MQKQDKTENNFRNTSSIAATIFPLRTRLSLTDRCFWFHDKTPYC